MDQSATEQLKFPVGRFKAPQQISAEDLDNYIGILEAFPVLLRTAVKGWSSRRLDTPYRPGGWTVRQLVHHVADSHFNAYVRFKLALTEDAPVIKPYEQDGWANLPDSQLPVAPSLSILDGVHQRWTHLLRQMPEGGWNRTFLHPEGNKVYSLGLAAALYAWHSRHHLQHILNLKEEKGW